MYARQLDLADMQSRLLPWLQGKMPQAQELTITPLQRPGGGLSNETFFFDMNLGNRSDTALNKPVLMQP